MQRKQRIERKRTASWSTAHVLAGLLALLNNIVNVLAMAGLPGAVLQTVGEVRVIAETAGVVRRTSKLASLAQHALQTGLLSMDSHVS